MRKFFRWAVMCTTALLQPVAVMATPQITLLGLMMLCQPL